MNKTRLTIGTDYWVWLIFDDFLVESTAVNERIRSMAFSFRLSSLIPDGLVARCFDENDDIITIFAHASADRGCCPSCNELSDRVVHSRYVRKVADLHCSGVKVELRISTRRFVCQTTFCRRKIIAERLDDCVLRERSRRTARLDTIVHLHGLALGGRPAAAFAKRLMITVSNDTLIRSVGRRSTVRHEIFLIDELLHEPAAVTGLVFRPDRQDVFPGTAHPRPF